MINNLRGFDVVVIATTAIVSIIVIIVIITSHSSLLSLKLYNKIKIKLGK